MSFAVPEIALAVVSVLLLILAAWRGDKALGSCSCIGAIALFALAGAELFLPQGGTAFAGALVADTFARFVKIVLFVTSALAIVMAPGYLRRTGIDRAEYPVLILFATLGMAVMVSAGDLLSLYLGLELQTLVLYVMAAIRRDHADASEAGLKYFVLGSLASAFLLFGSSLLYGFAGGIGFAEIQTALKADGPASMGVLVGAVFALSGIAFKLALVPFHLWAPDVYENAPTPVTAFFATAPKLAAFALLARLVSLPLAPLHATLQPFWIVLAVVTMAVGSFGGLAQGRIKRLLAYSSIANMGTILVGLAVGNEEGMAAALFATLLYFAATLGIFSVITGLLAEGRAAESISDFAGLGKTHPRAAGVFAFFLFSLAAVPPLPGFFGKLFVFLAAVRADMIPLALFGVLASVASAGYYLRIVKVMFFDEPSAETCVPCHDCGLCALRVALASALVIVVFVPMPLLASAREAVRSLGGL